MELSCFSPEQLMVRDAISKICANFHDVGSGQKAMTLGCRPVSTSSRIDESLRQDYWAAHDESGEYPSELHTALAKDGWIGIALPEEVGGAGLGISEATMMLQMIS